MRRELVEIAWFPLLSVAHDRAVVVLALGVGCWVLKRDEGYGLYVEPEHAASAAGELAGFEREAGGRKASPEPAARRFDPTSLFLFGWVAAAFMIAQGSGPNWWLDRGTSSSVAVVRDGEIWRVFTALTLHGDLAHFLANVATGLLFAAFLLPVVGGGLTWAGFVIAGGMGNWLNALGYGTAGHLSIGASTGVFGLLGILVACQTGMRLRNGQVRLWEFILPAGAGLALLAYLGTGGGPDPQGNAPGGTDLLAHLWGFLAGLATGGLAAAGRWGERVGRGGQAAAGLSALAILLAAWLAAWRWG
jgi:membrane associated rhomboid family serine protease